MIIQLPELIRNYQKAQNSLILQKMEIKFQPLNKIIPLKVEIELEVPKEQKNVVLNEDEFSQMIFQFFDEPNMLLIQFTSVTISILSWLSQDEQATKQILKEQILSSLEKQNSCQVIQKLLNLQCSFRMLRVTNDPIQQMIEAIVSQKNMISKVLRDISKIALEIEDQNYLGIIHRIIIRDFQNKQIFLDVISDIREFQWITLKNTKLILNLQRKSFYDIVEILLSLLKKEICTQKLDIPYQIINPNSLVYVLKIAQFGDEINEKFLNQLIETLFNKFEELPCMLDFLNQIFSSSKNNERENFTLIIQKQISNLCSTQAFTYFLLEEILTNSSQFNQSSIYFLQNYIIPSLENQQFFQEYFTHLICLTLFQEKINHKQLTQSYYGIFHENKHQFYKNLLEGFQMSIFPQQILLISDYQWNHPQQKNKTKTFSIESMTEFIAKSAKRLSHFNDLLKQLQNIQIQAKKLEGRSITFSEMFFVQIDIKQKSRIFSSITIPLFESVLITSFSNSNQMKKDELLQYSTKMIDLDETLNTLIKKQIFEYSQDGKLVTFNEQKFIEFYKNNTSAYDHEKSLLKIKATSTEKQIVLEERSPQEQRVIFEALLLRIIKKDRKIELIDLLQQIQKHPTAKQYLQGFDYNQNSEILKSLEKRQLIVSQGQIIYYNI